MQRKKKELLPNPFVCWVHSDAKQTKTSEFGVEKGLLQGSSKAERVAHAQKT